MSGSGGGIPEKPAFVRRAHRAAAVTFLIGAPDLEPDIVTVALDLTPTQVAVPGQSLETLDGTIIHVDHVGWWALDTTGVVKSSDPADHFRYLLEQLMPHREAILRLGDGGEVLFEVPWPRARAAEFDAECLRGAEALGAHIDFLGDERGDELAGP